MGCRSGLALYALIFACLIVNTIFLMLVTNSLGKDVWEMNENEQTLVLVGVLAIPFIVADQLMPSLCQWVNMRC